MRHCIHCPWSQTGSPSRFSYTLTVTHQGPFRKIAPTGKKMKIRVCNFKFKDGKMVVRRDARMSWAFQYILPS